LKQIEVTSWSEFNNVSSRSNQLYSDLMGLWAYGLLGITTLKLFFKSWDSGLKKSRVPVIQFDEKKFYNRLFIAFIFQKRSGIDM
jgi:hypothetical protein